MKDKITTHPRFIRKLEKDLEFLYTNNDYDSFIERFNEYETVTSNINLDLIEMFYHILISKKEYESMYQYAEKNFQTKEMTREEAEIHFNMILQSLFNLGMYEVLLEWSEIIVATGESSGITSSLIQFAKHCKEYAAKQMANGVHSEDISEASSEDIDIDKSLYSSNKALVITALEYLIDKKDDSYGQDVYSLLKKETAISVSSMMIIYLKEIEYDAVIEVNKFGEAFKHHTSEFKPFETSAKISQTIKWIVEDGNIRLDNEERIEQAIEMFLNISILWYPLKVPFTPKELAKGFISYTKVLNNELSVQSFYGHVAEWILKIEDEIRS